jgi:hypothetical protein
LVLAMVELALTGLSFFLEKRAGRFPIPFWKKSQVGGFDLPGRVPRRCGMIDGSEDPRAVH